MIPAHCRCYRLCIMLVTCLLLAPVTTATVAPAVQDLVDLKSIINAAADTIADPNYANLGFGLDHTGSSSQMMGTADLVNNITSTILRGKFQLDTNKTLWLSSINVVPISISTTIATNNNTLPTPSIVTPTSPSNTSVAFPTPLFNATLTFSNVTSDLAAPYLDYVLSLPSLSRSLIALGRNFHSELNAPVSDAINNLQQSLVVFQTALLSADLIGSTGVLRTIRASNSLESAQAAWGRPLNLPSGEKKDDEDDNDAGVGVAEEPNSLSSLSDRDRLVVPRTVQKRPPPKDGKFYTHQELWDRNTARDMKGTEAGASV